METNDTDSRTSSAPEWPALSYEEWSGTHASVHMYTQMVGKVKLALCPYLNQWWEVALQVTARGLTSGTIPWKGTTFDVEFDFIDHRLVVRVSDGRSAEIALVPRTVAEFYQLFIDALHSLGITPTIWTLPSEVGDPIDFKDDTVHDAYDADAVQRWWRILLATERVINRFRTSFRGKSSQVNLYWGGFDLNHTRFNGERAPLPPDADVIMRYGEDEANFSIGYWPGSPRTPANFYAYMKPEPGGVADTAIQPEGAGWSQSMGEFVFPYDMARQATDPAHAILTFFQSAYTACADLSGWDRAALTAEMPPLHPSMR